MADTDMDTAMTGRVREYLLSHPNEELKNKQLAKEFGVDTEVISKVIYNLRRNRTEQLPIVSVGHGTYMYKPEGINTERVSRRKQARTETTRKRFSDRSARGLEVRRNNYAHALHRRGVILFELMDAAPKHQNGSFAGAIHELVENAKLQKEFTYAGKYAPGAVNSAHKYLLKIGAIETKGPQFRYLVKHPDDIKPEMNSGVRGELVPERSTTVVFDSKPVTRPKSEKPVDAIDSVPPGDLARAVAEGMWTRYEWALTEIGRLKDLIADRDREIARLEELVNEMPAPTTSDFARRMLTSSPKR